MVINFMSWKLLPWAMRDAPVRNVTEFAVLVALVNYARDDGTAAFPSVATIQRITRASRRTVQRCLRELERRGIVRLAAAGTRRTRSYDLAIPPEVLEQVNRRLDDGARRQPDAYGRHVYAAERRHGARSLTDPSPKSPLGLPGERQSYGQSHQPDPASRDRARVIGCQHVPACRDGARHTRRCLDEMRRLA